MTDDEKSDKESPECRGTNESPAPEVTLGVGSGRVRWLPQAFGRLFSRRETR